MSEKIHWMGNKKLTVAPALFLFAGFAACTTSPPTSSSPAPENVGRVTSAVFANGGFESGTNNTAPTSWTLTTFLNEDVTIQTPQTRAGLDLQPGGTARTVTLVAASPESEPDEALGLTASLRWPKFGKAVALLNNRGEDKNVNSLKQTMTIGAGDIDSVDGLAHVRFVLAPVLEDPNHPAHEQPYFFVQLRNVTQNTTLYQDFNFANQPGVPWKTQGDLKYTDWALVDIAPGSARLAPGDQVELEVIGAGCSRGGHWGHVYLDGAGPTVPGMFVAATAPSAANQNTDLTYTLTYKNGGTAGAGNVVVEFNTPPNTTFVRLNAPGRTCTTPAAGATGLVRCTVGTVAAGASGTFTITTHIDNGTTGQTITAGNYSVLGTNISPLLGPKVFTNVTNNVTYADLRVNIPQGTTSVAAGAQVSYAIEVTNGGPNNVTGANVSNPVPTHLQNGSWTCAGTSGANCPVSAGTGAIHQNVNVPAGGRLTYTFIGTVNPAAPAVQLANIASVSVPAGATDPSPGNNSAGNYKQITVANGVACSTATHCTSGVCHADKLCGRPAGSGPCTPANGGTICRPGACSQNGTCITPGACNVDGDCSNGKWCNISSHTCTAKLPNNTAVPNDPPHANPTLNGQCSTPAATLTCVSGVCDADDDRCGFPNGKGPCNAANGNIVCRSGSCSTNGTCVAATGCNADGDCTGGRWCHVATHICTDKVPNGGDVPTDAQHTSPTLDGQCSVAAGTLTCVSGVCDVDDDKCGFPDGKGPCTPASAATVCRSGSCSAGGTCKPATGCNADDDCGASEWCNIGTHSCTVKLPNGSAVPNDPPHTDPTLDGTCTEPAAALTCASGVCDTGDNRCGYPDGKGPCTRANGGAVCRSGTCSTTGVCTSTNGCNVDADCNRDTHYCDTGVHLCSPKLPNGSPLPTVPSHTPALDGNCTVESGEIACVASVCDAVDNRCGYPNGGGPCTSANGAFVCRSGACNANDGKCGLEDGVGPCANDGACRSNKCDTVTKLCGAGCKVDSDCAANEYCQAGGKCALKRPEGDPCAGDNQCVSNGCNEQVCDTVFAAGSGFGCTTAPSRSGSSTTSGGFAAFGMSIVLARLVRRRRRGSFHSRF